MQLHVRQVHPFRRAFSLIEMLVAITILVLIILSVGLIFQSTSRSVGISQATMEMMSNVRSVQQQIAKDIAQMDRSQFLVIRSRRDNTANRRFDQMAFIANGTFFSRSGIAQSAPLSDSTAGTTAHIWWGQSGIEVASLPSPNPGNYIQANQANALALNALPSGFNDGDFILCRHTTLLFPDDRSTATPQLLPAGNGVPAYRSTYPNGPYALEWGAPLISPGAPSEGVAAHITSSRFAVAGMSGTDVLRTILTGHTTGGNLAYEAIKYCYRFKVLKSIYDSDATSNTLLNGYFRMTPIALQGTPSFSIQWTDGTLDNVSNPPGFKWYGQQEDGSVVASGTEDKTAITSSTLGDDYVAVFSPENRRGWPKALKITMRVVDPGPNPRLQPKEFTQIINLPE